MDPTVAPAADAVSAAGSSAAAVVELAGMVARLGELTDLAVADTVEGDRAVDAARIDAVALLERISAAAAATQAAVSVAFARSQVTVQQRQVLRDPEAVGRGIADQLALACHVSPSEGSRRLGIARALHTDLPATAALLRAGRISFYVAGLVVSETRHLEPERRRAVDAQLAAGLGGCAPRQAAALARRLAYAADPEGFVQRGRTARTDRRVSVRPAPDTMRACSPGTCPSSRAWRAGPRCGRTPTPSRAPGTSGPGTRSWPTPWSNGSPGRHGPSMCRPRW
jgi:hypothetical protein